MIQTTPKETIILGIDPGTNRIGYGVIKLIGKKASYITSGLIDIKEKYAPDQLRRIYDEISALVVKYSPDIASVEKLFFANNKKTAMTVAEARGVILLALSKGNVKIIEITPNEVKRIVTGHGQADKRAILKMIGLILGLSDFKPIDDTSDAIAIAIAGSIAMEARS